MTINETTRKALERIVDGLYPNLLTHVDLFGVQIRRKRKEIPKLNMDDVGTNLEPYWRKLDINKIQWLEDGILLFLEQENYCGSTCVNDDDDPSNPDYGRCHMGGGRSYAELTITFEQLKPFLKTEKAFLIDMIDLFPEKIAKLSGKTVEQVEQWKYIEWEKMYGEGLRNLYKGN